MARSPLAPLLAVAALAVCCRLVIAVADFSQPGPCTPKDAWTFEFPVPPELVKPLPKTVPLTITLPSCPSGAQLPFGSPSPPMLFFNGFKCQADYYTALMDSVVRWGLATVQYDAPFFPIQVDAVKEVALAASLAQFVNQQAGNSSSPLYGAVDPSKLLVGGHSRGGKLAGLTFAKQQVPVRACYLVDPVDVTSQVPVDAGNPSAAAALKKAGLPVGITAAGILSSCNPEEGSRQLIWEDAPKGSWLTVLPGAAHMSFADGGPAANALFYIPCKQYLAKDSREETVHLTSTPMLAWLWQQLYPGAPPQDSPIQAFFEWKNKEEAAGRLTFEKKGESASTRAAGSTGRVRAAERAPAMEL